MRGLIALQQATACAIVLAWATSGAMAADMPVKAPVAAPDAISWTGFHVGGHAGYGWAIDNHTSVTGNPDFPPGFRFNEHIVEGGFAGVQAGLNYQLGHWLLGIEADYSWAEMFGTTTTFSPITPGDKTVNSARVDWFYTVAGRLGLVWNNWLVFVKAGHIRTQTTGGSTLYDAAGNALTGHATRSEQVDGRLIGGGVEYALPGNWSAKLEYNFADFGDRLQTSTARAGNVVLQEVRNHNDVMHAVKLGVNYHFRLGALP
jgi:outer membrane immunogenic protein